MRIRLAVRVEHARCDAVVDAPGGTDLAALRPALAAAFEVPVDTPWWSGGRPLTDGARLGGPGLRPGDLLSPGGAGVPNADPEALHLAVVGGPGSGAVLPLGRGVHLIGRAQDCDLTLPDAEVSRRHAEVTVTTVGVTVRDLDSRNGTTCGGETLDRDGVGVEPGDRLRLGRTTLVVRPDRGLRATVRPGADGRVLVQRAAVDHGPLGVPTLTAPGPPPEHRRPRVAWVAALVPAVAAVGLAWFLHTWQFLAFAALTPVTVLGTAAGDRWSWRADRRRAAAAHVLAMTSFRRRRTECVTREEHARTARHPDPATCAIAAREPGARLWDRRPDDADRLHVRVGTGPRPSRAQVVGADGSTAAAGRLEDAPVCVDLTRGPLGVAGRVETSLAVARSVVVQLAVAHPPGELEFVLLTSVPDDQAWDWLRWLPHRVRRADRHTLRAPLLAELANRCRTESDRTGRNAGPLTVIVADTGGGLTGHADLEVVLDSGPAVGIHAVCVDRSPSALPAACSTVAVVSGSTHAELAISGDGWDTADGRPDVLGAVIADQVDAGWCDQVARWLAPLDDGTGDSGLPRHARLTDLVAVTDPDLVAETWAAHPPGATAPLRAVVGVAESGPAVLDLTADGPHALVAGTTGSGKSELLQTWLASLAVAFPPDDLGLLLVDYKGGAAFGACSRLPHTVGLVTDLDHHLTGRVLRSLDAEIHRRERLFAGVGAADLSAYRRTGGPAPVPRLLVVVDEFATLAADLPDFLPGLVDVAQRGRSLGLHLVLATQRPGGVVSPAVRANTTLRIALRVTDPAESHDVVGAVDAAALDPDRPGRAVVRTARGRTVMQTARVSAPVAETDTGVRVVRVDPWVDPPPAAAPTGTRSDLDELVEVLEKAWARRFADGFAAPAPIWRPPLPDTITAAAIDTDGPADPLRPVIGLRDQPDRQRQFAERIDFVTGGTLLVAGAARTGRSGLLQTVAHTAARAELPTVVIHAGGLAGLADAGSTVGHVGADDPESLGRLVDLLEHEWVARRREVAAVEPLVVLVDEWPAVARALDDLDGGRSVERLLALWRAAGSVGVTVVVTGDRSVLGTRTASAADRLWLSRLADPADAALAGMSPRDVPESMPPGRVVCAPAGDTVQLVVPPLPAPARAPRPTLTGLRLRPLPVRVDLPPRSDRRPGVRLGSGGDAAEPVEVDPWAGSGRWLISGPPRSGRSTTLGLIGAEARDASVLWWAGPRSPLAAVARDHGWTGLDAAATRIETGRRCLILLDDVDELADAPLSDAVVAALRATPAGLLAVACAGRPDELLTSYRGVVAEIRRARRGLLLHPGPVDGDLVGVSTRRSRADWPPGRGLLVADGVTVGGRAVGTTPLTLQVGLLGHHGEEP